MSSDLPPSTVGPHGSGGVHVNGCATMPPDMRASHRVQIVVRGRRFEMPIATAIQHCSALAYFFGLPLEGCALGAVSLTGQATTSGEARPTMVWDLQSEDPSQDAQAIEAAMTAHYNQVAWPRAAHELQLSPASPPPIMPEAVRCISTQTTPVVWVFQFPRRPSSATAATTPVDESDPADDPQLVLQPDYVGVILVHLRKMTEHDARGSDSEVPARTPGPTLSSLRWNELTWEQQLSVAQVVRSLLVIPCMGDYSWPTAVAQEEVEECSTNCRVASGFSRDSDDEVHAVGVIACGHCGTVGHESDVCPF